MSSNLNNEQESVFFYNERKWRKKMEMENFGQQNVFNDTVIFKKGTLKKFTINVHRLTGEIVNTCSEFTSIEKC